MNIKIEADEVLVAVRNGVCQGCGCGVGRYQHSVSDCLEFYRTAVRGLLSEPKDAEEGAE